MNDFLSEYKPSCITSNDMRVEWIAVNRGMHTLDLQRPPLIEEMKISFKSSINSYSPQSRPHPGLSPTVLDELARAYNITSGKWLIFLVVSLIWLQRKKGFAKVSVMKPARRGTLNSGNTRTRSSQSHSCVISVYVGNYLNEDEVMELRADLRSIGVDRRISFKPDAYSHLGIYRNNEWGIPPSRYIL
ncbi:hypothetical protein BDP27DRAFT_1319473 [Rhodocollybia butyracea]|uniref:Uncharacterized protein n=1 Tax=Rhodocollybia butyracea TaxID=206335 RepID=A0A9P5UAJ6_9AGAR|nr:hypothetical protein BDP27DRAFT_1319473 [Rhodocollybia butyracea]